MASWTALRRASSSRRLRSSRSQHLGPDELLVGAKLEFDGGLEADALCDAVDRVEQAIRAAVPSARVIYLEPAIARPS